MAMSFMISRTSHTVVVPVALRAMASPTSILTGSVANALTGDEHGGLVRTSNYRYLSTAAEAQKKLADKEFIKILKSEIKYSERYIDQVPETPANFPFKIKDIPGDGRIKLTRKLGGEKIEVVIDGPYDEYDYDDDDDDDDDDYYDVNCCHHKPSSSTDFNSDEEEEQVPERRKFKFREPHIQLNVKISKENGKKMNCLMFANNGTMFVRNVYLDKYCSVFRPGIWNKEDPQDSWRDYLAGRGIEDGIVDFLTEYMDTKFERDNLLFLKNVREFVKE